MLYDSFHYLHQLKDYHKEEFCVKIESSTMLLEPLICLSYSVPSCIQPEMQIADLSVRSINWCLKWSPLKWTSLHRSLVRPRIFGWCKSSQRFLLYSVVNFCKKTITPLFIACWKTTVRRHLQTRRKKSRSMKHGFYIRLSVSVEVSGYVGGTMVILLTRNRRSAFEFRSSSL